MFCLTQDIASLQLDDLPKGISFCKSRRAYKCQMKNLEKDKEFRLRLNKCNQEDVRDELLQCRSEAISHYYDRSND
jgi:hypothetical protein